MMRIKLCHPLSKRMRTVITSGILVGALFVGSLLYSAPLAFAQGSAGSSAGSGSAGSSLGTETSGGGTGLVNPLNTNSLPELLHAILKGVVEIGAIFLTFMIVYVGFLFVAARGNSEKLSSARTALVWTIIGGLILLGAEAISLVIQNTVATL